jgi:class 3 adenylate cyclase
LWEEPALSDRTTKPESVVLPIGIVTLLLADFEESARRWDTDTAGMISAVNRLRALVAEVVGRHSGVQPPGGAEPDECFVAVFSRASDALACALALQLAVDEESRLGGADLRLRAAVHTGEVQLRDEGNYIGSAINRARRLRAIGHAGQTLLSQATYHLVVDRLPDEAAVSYLGRYRLRDLSRPEDVYQLTHPHLPPEVPPLRSLDALPNNLPARLSSFIGRESDMARLKVILADDRLVTLMGAGGVGKTRLGLQLAADTIEQYPDGVWWVDLARITDAGLVTNAVAATLAFKEIPFQPLLET